jgi:heme exporter protein A
MTHALELRHLECVRGTRTLFTNLSAVIDPGQMLRVRGENGSGKTSLLRMLCGLSMPERGEIHWSGQPVGSQREAFNAQLIYLGHAPALKDELSALENLQASQGLAGRPWREPEALAALAQAGLRGRERLPARVLSQGQRRRAGLARLALGQAAGLWVLDEPFNALDDVACGWLQGLVDAQLARGGVVVLTNHQARAWDAAPPQAVITLTPPAATPQ